MSSSQVMEFYVDKRLALQKGGLSQECDKHQDKSNGHGFYRNKTTTTKTAIIRLFWLTFISVFAQVAIADESDTVSWNSEQFIALHGDINGDGRDDLLLQPRGSETGSVTFQSSSRQYLTDDSHFLTFLPNYASARLLLADINGDGKDDLVTISTGEARVRLSNGNGFAEVSQTLSNPESLHFLNAFDAYLYYAGDFNGDGKEEFIALSDNPHRADRAHVLMQTEDNGQLNVHQSPGEEAVWAQQQSSRLIIADYNNDGRDDIFAVARKTNDPHWLVLSSDKGRFSTRGQQIRHRLTNHDWDDERHSIMAINGLLTPGVELLRRNNRPGGFDERGEWHSENMGEPGDVAARGSVDKQQIVNKPQVANKQAPVNPEVVRPSLAQVSLRSSVSDRRSSESVNPASINSASTNAIDCSDPLYNPTSGTEGSGCSFLTLPDTPTDYPTISGSAYKPLNIGFTVGFAVVADATYYELYAGDGGLDPAAVTYTKVYSGSVFQPTFSYSTAGHRYYKYKACNSVGCSGLSPWRRIYVYDAPEAIRSPVLSASSVYSNATVSLDFVEAGYSVDGTNHKVWQSFNGGAETLIYDFTRTQWQQNQHHVSKTLTEPGSYVWRAQACSPSVGCGPSTNFTITVTNRAPVAVADTFTHLQEDTPAALSVLANDTDPDGHPVSLHDIVAVPLGGQVVINGNQAVYTPYNQWCGDDRFTYRVKDAFGAVSSAVLVSLTVNCVNDAPYVSHLSSGYTVNEDTSATITYTLRDFDSDVNAASVSVLSSSNPAVLPLANIVPGGSGSARTLQLQGAAHQYGSSDVTFRVSDGTDAQDYTFNVVIHPVNDLPVATGLAGHVLTEDTPLTIAVPVADVETPAAALTLTSVGSSNYTVLPTPNVVISGSGATRSITLTPAANQSGSGIIWLQLSDGTDSATYGLTFTVNPVNDTPTAGPLSGHVLDEDESQAITLTVNDVETSASEVVLRVKGSSNTALVPVSHAVISGSGNTRTLTLTPAENRSGSGTIWLGVHDGTVEATYGLSYTVNPVNDAPTVSTIPVQVMDEDTALSVPFTVNDIDTDLSQLNLSATAGNPLLVNTSDITFSGSGQNRTLTITPLPGRDGETDITVHVNDGTQTTSRTFHLTVNGVNDAPTLSAIAAQRVDEDTPITVYVKISDKETPSSQLTLHAISSSNLTLLPLSQITFGGSDNYREVTLTPVANEYGVSTVTLGVSDGELSTSQTFTFSVNGINDLPVIQPPADVNMLTRQVLSVPLVVSDVETPLENLTITASAHDPSLISPDRLVPQFVNGQHVLQVTAGSSPGSTPVDVRVHDGTTSRKATFNVTIVRPPEPPTITGVPPSTVRVGQTYDFTPGAEDRNPGDTLTFVSANLPAWLTFDAATGRIHGTPGTLDIGTRSGIRLGVTDNYNYPGEGLKYVYLNDFAITVQQAQDPANPETPVAPSVFADPGIDPMSEKVGRVVGEASVSDHGGAAWSLPIDLPSGIAGITPQLSVGYSSKGGNGILGMGWYLGASSEVKRCRSTPSDDEFFRAVNFDAQDVICLDGQRLVLVEGVAWQDGAVYQPRLFNGQRVRLSVIDNVFTFAQDMGNGTTRYFGTRDDARQRDTVALRDGMPAAHRDYKWLLSRQVDAFGNTIHWHYNPENDETKRLTRIDWSGHKVELNYSHNRVDKNHAFFKGNTILDDALLTDIRVYHYSQPATAFDSYHFAYGASTSGYRLRLNSMTRCNGDENGVCLPATTFDYDTAPTGIGFNAYTDNAQRYDMDTLLGLSGGHKIISVSPMDYNGDGYNDLAVVYELPGNQLYLGFVKNEGGTFVSQSVASPVSLGASSPNSENNPKNAYDSLKPTEYAFTPVDFDANGTTDILLNGEILYFDHEGRWTRQSIAFGSPSMSVVDFDGNGLPDINNIDFIALNYPDDTPATRFQHTVQLFDRNALIDKIGPTSTACEGGVCLSDFQELHFDKTAAGNQFDVDGDGQMDLLWSGEERTINPDNENYDPLRDGIITFTQLFKVSRTGATTWKAVAPVDGDSDPNWGAPYTKEEGAMFSVSQALAPARTYGDVNGDGLSDHVAFRKVHGSGLSRLSVSQMNGDGIDFSAMTAPTLTEVQKEHLERLKLIDMDGDGRDDMVFWLQDGSRSAMYISVIRHNTFQPIQVMDGLSDSNGFSLEEEARNKEAVIFSDIDGDGQPALMIADLNRHNVNSGSFDYQLVVYPDRNTGQHFNDVLTTVTDGFGYTTQFTYGYATDPTLYSTGSDDTPLTETDDSAVRQVRPSGPLVKRFTELTHHLADGSPAYKTLDYHYQGNRVQAGGRGSLGFEAITRKNQLTGITTVTRKRQDYPFNGQMASETRTYNGTVLKVTQQTAFADIALNGGKTRFVAPRVTEVHDYGFATDNARPDRVSAWSAIKQKTVRTVTRQVTGSGRAIIQTADHTDVTDYRNNSEVSTSQVSTGWDVDINRWLLNRKSTETRTLIRAGHPNVSLKTDWEYDDTHGLVSAEIRNPDSHEARFLRTEFVYDEVGNRIQATQCSKHFAPSTGAAQCGGAIPDTTDDPLKVFRRQRSTFTPEGRHLVSTANALFTETTLSDYNIHDAADTMTSPDGVKTYTRLDGFGKPYYQASDDGSYSITRYRLCQTLTDCPASALMRKTIIQPDNVVSYEYTDGADRVVRSKTTGFDGRFIVVNTDYDERGRAVRVSEPHYEGSGDTVANLTEFDGLSREIRRHHPDGTQTAQLWTVDEQHTIVTASYSGTNWSSSVNRTTVRVTNGKGEAVSVIDDNGNAIDYIYDAAGKLVRTVNVDGSVILTPHDDQGRQLSLTDPDKGHHEYGYNALAELTETRTPGDSDGTFITETHYRDAAGREVRRVLRDASSTVVDTQLWQFNAHQLTGETFDSRDTANTSTQYFYDTLGRVNRTSVNLGGSVYHTRTTFDEFGRVFQQFDASGDDHGLRFHYQYGYVAKHQEAREGTAGVVYLTIDAMDARGNVIQETAGNGLTTHRAYNRQTGFLTRITTGTHQQLDYEYDGLGNLHARINLNGLNGQTQVEHFTYDNLSRVTGAWLDNTATHTLDYQDNGNLQSNSFVENGAAYHYGQAVTGCGVTPGIHAVTSVGTLNFCYDKRGNQTKRWKDNTLTREVTYSAFDKPVQMDSVINGETRTTRFTYDGNRSRWLRTDEENGETTTTLYVGNLEIETRPDGLTQTKRYVGNNVIDTHRSNGTRTTHYLGHDHIGSIDIITDEAGTLLENLSFDLWGNRRDATGWSVVQQPFTQLSLDTVLNITRQGFTGHEHVDHADVIHMNGRIYDPTLGRFMQADPIVQQPENLQNLNRYTYVFNNPLSYTDPTGYCAASSFSTKQPSCEIQQQAEAAAVTNDKETREAKENEGAAASESNDSGGWFSSIASSVSEVADSMVQFGKDHYTDTLNTLESKSKELVDAVDAGDVIGAATAAVILLETTTDLVPNPKTAIKAAGRKALKMLSKKGRKGKGNGNGGGGGCNCFAAGTDVVTKDGYTAIEDITVGDEVLAKNVLTGEQDWRPVTETFIIPDNEVYELLLDTGDATPSRLTVSETHPFYVPARGWVESQSLNPGDVIETDTFSAAVVISLNDLHRREATYNFTVDEFHSYYVSQDRVLVHNQDKIVCKLTGEGEVTKGADSTLSRKAAFREAKEKAGIPRSQQPSNTYREKIRDQQGHVEGRVYEFKNADGSTATIREHTLGHKLGNHGSHFNSELRNVQGIKQSLKNNADSHTYIKQD